MYRAARAVKTFTLYPREPGKSVGVAVVVLVVEVAVVDAGVEAGILPVF